MKQRSIVRMVPLALLVATACVPARQQQAAAPRPVVTLSPEKEALLERLLQAHFGGDVDPKARETFRGLFAAALAHQSALATPSTPSAPPPEIVRALRDLQASPGDSESIHRILLRLVAEQEARRNASETARP